MIFIERKFDRTIRFVRFLETSHTRMFPIRCYSCNAVVAQHWPGYAKTIQNQDSLYEYLQKKNVKRMCCVRMFLGHVDMTANNMLYPNKNLQMDEKGTVLKREIYHKRNISCD